MVENAKKNKAERKRRLDVAESIIQTRNKETSKISSHIQKSLKYIKVNTLLSIQLAESMNLKFGMNLDPKIFENFRKKINEIEELENSEEKNPKETEEPKETNLEAKNADESENPECSQILEEDEEFQSSEE